MIKKYIYKEETYLSSYSVRTAISEIENLAFGPEPEGELAVKQAFWADLGVTYIEEPDPEPALEDLKEQKLQVLEQKFLQWYEQDAVVTSSLGFVADSDVRSVTDVSGLITVAEATPTESRTTVAFMDHVNQPHMLSLEQLKTLQLEIIQNGQAAYQRKWELRTTIEGAEDKEALEAIEIFFTGCDFSVSKKEPEVTEDEAS